MSKKIIVLTVLNIFLLLTGCATKPNPEVLSQALVKQNYKVVKKQLQAGVDLNAPIDEQGNTVIQQAILTEDVTGFEHLVEQDFNPFIRNKNNLTAIDLAMDSPNERFSAWAKNYINQENAPDAFRQAVAAIKQKDSLTLKTLLAEPSFYWYTEPLIGHESVSSSCFECLEVLQAADYNFTKVNNLGQTPLDSAVNATKLTAVEILVKNKEALKIKNAEGLTALHKFFDSFYTFPWGLSGDALVQTRQKILRTLVQAGADVNAQDKDGWTPLLWSIRNSEIGLIEEVLRQGANPNLVSKSGYSPLMEAVNYGKTDVVQLLLEAKAEVNLKDIESEWSALHYVANGSESAKQQDSVQAEIATLLIKAGAHKNALTKTGSHTPLTLATVNNRPLTAAALIAGGVDATLAFNNSWSPLMRAVYDGNMELISVLLTAADIHQRTNDGWTALHFTVNKNGALAENEELAVQIAQLLLTHKANPNLRTESGKTPLHLAVSNDRLQVMKVLLQAKADPSLQSNGGWTPLMDAVFGGNVEAVKLLAKTKKGLNDAGEDGWTALHLCANTLKNGNRNHDGEIAKILLANGASIDKVNKEGRTALILSVLNERPEVLRILLANKANVNTVDHSGYTANSYAVEDKKWGLSALLQGITAQQARENSLYPAQPAQRAGVVTCNTRCLNGDCYRTYGDGRKVRFQAQQKYNPVSGNWEYDSGTCN